MSSALDAASLVMIPSGYEDGTLGSLKPTDGTGDFTFTRGSNISATRVNADGNIEKGYENLLYPSNDFSVWSKTRTSVTSGQVGYDGSTDAWLLEASATTQCWISKSHSATGICSFSVYAKANTATGVLVALGGTSGTGYARFDLTNGVTGSVVGSGVASSIEAVEDGWYRCSMFTTNTTITLPYIYVIDDVSTSNVTAGNSIYIQDAMLNQGLVAYPYVETTTAPVAGGILEDMPRLDYSNGSCPSLLLEPSRTNETPHSEYYDVFLNYGTGKCTFTPNAAISPEGFQNSFKVVLNSNQNNGGGAISTLMRRFTQGDIITFSMFFKADEFDQVILGGFFQNESATFNLKDGSVVSQASNVIDAYSIPFGNGWYRCVVTYTFQNAIGNGYLYSGFRVVAISDGVSSLGDGVKGLFAYGAQIEEASYPTSYIPTYGVSQTRLQDSARVTGLAQSFPLTAYIEIDVFSITTYNQFQFRQDAGNYVLRIGNQIRIGPTDTIGNNTLGSNKFALSVDASGNYELFKNGTSLRTGTITGSIDEIRSDAAGYEVKQLLLFPTALSDEACIELTTI